MEKHRSVFEKDITIAPSLCDSTAKLSIPGVFSVFMDMAAEHAEELGCGIGMIKKRGLFWITVRTKILVRKLPDLSSHAICSRALQVHEILSSKAGGRSAL